MFTFLDLQMFEDAVWNQRLNLDVLNQFGDPFRKFQNCFSTLSPSLRWSLRTVKVNVSL